MKPIIAKNIMLSILLLSGLTTYSSAESNPVLPTSTQVQEEDGENNITIEGIVIVDEIIIKPEDQKGVKRNPALKEGEACDDSNLEAAELGPDYNHDIPMAETIPCDKVDCSDLKPAKLLKDSYKKIPMAKTTKLKPCVRKK